MSIAIYTNILRGIITFKKVITIKTEKIKGLYFVKEFLTPE